MVLRKSCDSVLEVVSDGSAGEARRDDATLVEISIVGREEVDRRAGVSCVMLVPDAYGAFEALLTAFLSVFGVNSLESKTIRLLESTKITRTAFSIATSAI